MSKILSIVIALLVSVPLVAQESQTRSVGHFTGVKVAEGVDVYLIKGDKESAKVEVYGTSIQNVITEVSGSYLKVHMRDGNYHGRVEVKVFVTYTELDRLSASSAGNIYSQGVIKTSSLEIGSSSAGTIEVEVDAGEMEISASSAGEIEIKGKARSLKADASSAGEIDAYDLEVENVTVEASSAGSVKVNVKEALNANASSGGSIRYRGNPSKSITNSSSGGSVKKSS
ncbi:head GIN domain-containing protein [Chryseolinea sp. T2]|uniref:head GIN domain-containing protein n=1 Tax=Chryseolinea sp. T2 TaxID=3129255 RepID=UPI003077BFFE